MLVFNVLFLTECTQIEDEECTGGSGIEHGTLKKKTRYFSDSSEPGL